MMTYLLKIRVGGRGACTAYIERIRGGVALTEDQVFRDNDDVHVLTKDPGQFITAYYEDGFPEEIIICEAS